MKPETLARWQAKFLLLDAELRYAWRRKGKRYYYHDLLNNWPSRHYVRPSAALEALMASRTPLPAEVSK